MKSMLKFSLFLLAFLAFNFSAQAQQCQKTAACCSKSTAKVEKQEKANDVKQEASAKLVVNVTPAATQRANEVTQQLENFISSPAYKNCRPADCQPKNCDPTNCDPSQCQPANCKKKAEQL